jgi:hypothetical protein
MSQQPGPPPEVAVGGGQLMMGGGGPEHFGEPVQKSPSVPFHPTDAYASGGTKAASGSAPDQSWPQ